MGIVYYSRYYEFFEAARTDMLRDMGLPYSEFEATGFLMPVIESHCKYLQSAHFDELLKIECTIKDLPRIKMTIHYRVVNEDEDMLAQGYTKHAFLDKNGNIRRVPKHFLELF